MLINLLIAPRSKTSIIRSQIFTRLLLAAYAVYELQNNVIQILRFFGSSIKSTKVIMFRFSEALFGFVYLVFTNILLLRSYGR